MNSIGFKQETEVMSFILIVDDEKKMRDLLNDVLGNHLCYQASTVDEAVALLETIQFDAVLTDISLPGKSGMELLGLVRQRQPDTPVIVISGIHDPEHARGIIEMGAFGYLGKPFRLDEVEAMVERAIESRRLKLMIGEERSYARRYITQVEVQMSGVLIFDDEREEGILMVAGYTHDISETGVGIIIPESSVDERRIVGAKFHLVLELPGTSLDTEATVVRYQNLAPEKGCLIGAQFTNMSGRDRVLLLHYLHGHHSAK
jgi:Response regulator containing CheY-like receiver, AAA-type ATPase, and DNA-binding domains